MSENKVYSAEDIYPPYDFEKYSNGERSTDKEKEPQRLYHVTGWDEVKELEIGDALTLKPGTQNAQGKGVYFSEDLPRIEAADALQAAKKDPVAIIEIVPQEDDIENWYRSKVGQVIKHKKPRTWHTKDKELRLVVMTKNLLEIDGYTVPVFHCAHRWVDPKEESQPDISK